MCGNNWALQISCPPLSHHQSRVANNNKRCLPNCFFVPPPPPPRPSEKIPSFSPLLCFCSTMMLCCTKEIMLMIMMKLQSCPWRHATTMNGPGKNQGSRRLLRCVSIKVKTNHTLSSHSKTVRRKHSVPHPVRVCGQ